MNPHRPRWSSQTKLTASLLMLAFFVYLLSRFRVVVPPFILAVILAFVLSPAVDLLQNRLRLPRVIATLLVYMLLIVVLGVLPALVISPLASELTSLNVDIQRILLQIEDLLANQIVLPGGFIIDSVYVVEQLSGSLQTLFEPFVGRTFELVVNVISSLVWIVFILVVSFYLVKDWHKLRDWLGQIPPPTYRADIIRLREEINKVWSAFFRGQLLLAIVVAIIFTIIGFALGLPFALAMGALAGLLEFLPSIGHGIWLFIASLLAFFLGSTWMAVPNWIFMLIVIGLHLVFQQFDLNYLIPRIIGRRVQLPPLVVILGIVTGAAIAGVLGIALAAPTIASARILGRYIFANMFDVDPFPEEVAPPLPPPDPNWWRLRGRQESDAA